MRPWCVIGMAAVAAVVGTAADAQDIRGRTILYDNGQGQIYVARTGNVFRSYKGRAVGVQYKIGGTLRVGKPSCLGVHTASLSGNTLTLHQELDCADSALKSSDHIVVVVNGDTCQLTERIVVQSSQGNTAFTEPGENCHVVEGNRLAQ